MAETMPLSDHCLADHIAMADGSPKTFLPPQTIGWRIKIRLMRLDRKTHFTGLRGRMWKMLGVERSPKNPNVCNLCQVHMEAGRLSEITVLFADARGYTILVQDLGVEKVTPLMDYFFRRCAEIVIRHDGIVDHFMGDAVMAFFNVPIHREDHTAQAVTAAQEIQEAVVKINRTQPGGDGLRVGIGIAAGMAATGAVGSNSCSDYTAMGESVNIAARLQGDAAAGEILLEEKAYSRVQGKYPGAEERILQLKNIRQPVRAYAVVKAAVVE